MHDFLRGLNRLRPPPTRAPGACGGARPLETSSATDRCRDGGALGYERGMRFAAVAACFVVVLACSGSDPCEGSRCDVADAGAGGGMGTDGGAAGDGGAGSDAGADAGVDAGCDDCTLLTVAVGAAQGPMTRAQHGLEADGGVLYVEAHFGGDPACPSMTSPTPQRTLIIAGLRPLPSGAAITYAEGLRVTFFDFEGALTTAPLVRAIDARAVSLGGTPGETVRFSLTATFADGGVSGSFAAPHCASLDGP